MSLEAQTAEALLRAAFVSGASLAVAELVARLLSEHRRPRKIAAWALLLAPFLTPPILTGYAWAPAVTAHPAWSEAIYITAMAMRFAPVAVLALHFVPPPLSSEGAFCFRLLSHCHFGRALRFRLRGAGAGPWIALAIVFLLAFAEFELAAMWSLKTWTVWLFDAQAGGLALARTLQLAAIPAFCQFAALAVLITIIARSAPTRLNASSAKMSARPAAWLYLIAAALLITLLPLASVLRQGFPGWPLLAANAVLTKDLSASLFFASGAVLLVHVCQLRLRRISQHREGPQSQERLPSPSFRAERSGVEEPLAFAGSGGAEHEPHAEAPHRRCPQRSSSPIPLPPLVPGTAASEVPRLRSAPLGMRGLWRRLRRTAAILLATPGLLGALPLSLLVLAAIQVPALRPLRDTPLPLLGTLALLLLPIALLLRWMRESTRPGEALHIARTLHNYRLTWQLDTRRAAWSLFLLLCWAWFDFTASSLLAPIGMTPVFVRLHNLAHYGQSAVLSAMLCAALLAPFAVLILGAAGHHLHARIRGE